MPLTSSVAGRGCRRHGPSACRVRASLLAGAAAGEVLMHAARLRRMPFASIDAGRCCRRRSPSACRLHAWLLAGAAAGEVLVHAACSHWLAGAAVGEQRAHAPCIHWCWQEKPPVEPQHMLLACIVACRSCRRRKASCARRSPCTKRPGGSRQSGALVPRGLAGQGKAEPLYRLNKLVLVGAASCLAGAAAGEQCPLPAPASKKAKGGLRARDPW